MDISDYRREYMSQGIDVGSLASSPFSQFETWFQQALDANIEDANAISLATASPNGAPSIRVLLLKQFDEQGFVFYTNYDSKKSRQLEANPQASILLQWLPLNRQIRIEGRCERVSAEQSETYFKSRPRGSQIGAWCSEQSRSVASRAALEDEYSKIEAQYDGQEIPLPPFWGGYRLVPNYFEFWQGRENRLHDRIEYSLKDGAWVQDRLAP